MKNQILKALADKSYDLISVEVMVCDYDKSVRIFLCQHPLDLTLKFVRGKNGVTFETFSFSKTYPKDECEVQKMQLYKFFLILNDNFLEFIMELIKENV